VNWIQTLIKSLSNHDNKKSKNNKLITNKDDKDYQSFVKASS